MKLATATTIGGLLFAVSVGLLAAADEAADLLAVTGGIGVVISGALLGLTFLTWRWCRDASTQVGVRIDGASVYDELDDAIMGTVHADGVPVRLEDATAV